MTLILGPFSTTKQAKKDGGGDGFGKRAQSAGDKNAAAVAASAANSPQKK